MGALDEGRLAEIEAAARAVPDGRWIARGGMVWQESASHLDYPVAGERLLDAYDAAHIAAADPATVLALVAEVRAARAALERVEALPDEWRNADEWTRCVCGSCCADDVESALAGAEGDAGGEVAPAGSDGPNGVQRGVTDDDLREAIGRAKKAAETRAGDS